MSDYFALDILAFRNHKMEQLVNPSCVMTVLMVYFQQGLKSTQDKYIGFEWELWH